MHFILQFHILQFCEVQTALNVSSDLLLMVGMGHLYHLTSYVSFIFHCLLLEAVS